LDPEMLESRSRALKTNIRA